VSGGRCCFSSLGAARGTGGRKPLSRGLNAYTGEHRLFRVEELWICQPWRGRISRSPQGVREDLHFRCCSSAAHAALSSTLWPRACCLPGAVRARVLEL
jgi:hypothetical protein